MGKVLIAAAMIGATSPFYRCGRAFDRDGVIVGAEEFTAEQWEVLRAEPMLHIRPAPEEAALEAAAEGDLRAEIRRVIAALAPAEFGEDGAPLAEAIRKALPGTGGITKKLVADVWAELKDQKP